MVGGIPTGLQVCIVREQLSDWSVPDCLTQHVCFDAQPVGVEGTLLGTKTLVKLQTIIIGVTGKSLLIPCYEIIMDSCPSKPIW